jgi:hypothetical protein
MNRHHRRGSFVISKKYHFIIHPPLSLQNFHPLFFLLQTNSENFTKSTQTNQSNHKFIIIIYQNQISNFSIHITISHHYLIFKKNPNLSLIFPKNILFIIISAINLGFSINSIWVFCIISFYGERNRFR